MEHELTIAPKRSVSDSAGGKGTPTAVTHQACFPYAVREHRDHQRRPTRHDDRHPECLRAVMTSEPVPAEQPGALVDECRIRDRTVETGNA